MGQVVTDLLAELVAAVERREPVVLVTVIATRRSVPRRAGSKMLVYGDGRSTGTIGGGEMEARVLTAAADALATGRTSRLHYSLLDPSAGDPGVCGGEVELYLEPYMPRTTIYVVGAGHVGRAVIELAHWLGYRVVAWDDRSGVLDPNDGELPGEVVTVTGPIADAVAIETIDAHTRVVMVTRNAALDVELLPVLLATPASYIGLMGSDRRWATTRRKLLDLGLDEAELARVHAPIGVEISAETPAEIAVSIMAEVISHERAS